MMSTTLKYSEVERYLGLLGLTRSGPCLAELKRIVQAHLAKVPFENISKLYRIRTSGLRAIPNFSMFLDGIEEYHFGGTCYSNNYYLYRLLISLDYDAVLCGADMSRPDVHMICIVKVEGREYIVDAGYAAPFLDPLPRYLSSVYTVSWGADRYVLNPQDSSGRSQLTLYRDGSPHHGYLVNPLPRHIGEFRHTITASFRPDATFMNAVLLVRYATDQSTVLHNLTHIASNNITTDRTALRTTGDLIRAIEEYFSIPSSISRIALRDLSLSQDAWS
jgi:N-hydroxyarylamine O-acetyltransferase